MAISGKARLLLDDGGERERLIGRLHLSGLGAGLPGLGQKGLLLGDGLLHDGKVGAPRRVVVGVGRKPSLERARVDAERTAQLGLGHRGGRLLERGRVPEDGEYLPDGRAVGNPERLVDDRSPGERFENACGREVGLELISARVDARELVVLHEACGQTHVEVLHLKARLPQALHYAARGVARLDRDAHGGVGRGGLDRTLEDALVGLPAKPHGRAEHDEHAARDERERTTAATGLFSRLFARLFFRFFVGRAFSLRFGLSLILSLILIPGQGGRRHRACVLLCGFLRFGCGGFGVLLLFLRHDGKSWVECSGPSGGLCLRRMKCGTF